MTRRRAREDDGTFKADDPVTESVNEAFEADPVEPTERRAAVPDVIETPAGTVKIHQPAPAISGADLLSYCHGELAGAISEEDAQLAVEIAHASLEAYVGGTIPRRPAQVEQTAILQCALHVILMGWNEPGRILREREIPAVSRAAVTYRLLGRRRPAIYNPQRIGGPVRGVSRLTR